MFGSSQNSRFTSVLLPALTALQASSFLEPAQTVKRQAGSLRADADLRLTWNPDIIRRNSLLGGDRHPRVENPRRLETRLVKFVVVLEVAAADFLHIAYDI